MSQENKNKFIADIFSRPINENIVIQLINDILLQKKKDKTHIHLVLKNDEIRHKFNIEIIMYIYLIIMAL